MYVCMLGWWMQYYCDHIINPIQTLNTLSKIFSKTAHSCTLSMLYCLCYAVTATTLCSLCAALHF